MYKCLNRFKEEYFCLFVCLFGIPIFKLAKKAYTADIEYNEEIEIAKFVCDELDKFSNEEFRFRLAESKNIYGIGLGGLAALNTSDVKAEIASTKNMPKSNAAEKAIRKAAIEIAKNKLDSVKAIKKYYKNTADLVQPDYALIEKGYEKMDAIEAEIKSINDSLKGIKKSKDQNKLAEAKSKLEELKAELKTVAHETKILNDESAKFSRAAKSFNDAKKLITQSENYEKLDEISAIYDEAKARHEKAMADAKAEAERKNAEEKAYREKLKAEKKARK